MYIVYIYNSSQHYCEHVEYVFLVVNLIYAFSNIPFQGPTHIKRATTEKLRDVFQRYASQEIRGERYMTNEDFVRRYLGLFPEASYNQVSQEKKNK